MRIGISSLPGTGVGHLYKSVHEAYDSAMLDVPTARMTRILQTATEAHQLPIVATTRIKLRYAHQGGSNPFLVIIHGNQTNRVPGSYKRYLMNYFRETLKLKGTQVKLVFKTGDNPFEGRNDKRAKLSPSQMFRKNKKNPKDKSTRTSKKK